MVFSKTQIDKLGERLKSGQLADADIKTLEEYRRSFSDTHEDVVRAIREQLAPAPDTSVIDRRKASSHGYRAVHVVVRHEGWQVKRLQQQLTGLSKLKESITEGGTTR